jgi:hypothetical protein
VKCKTTRELAAVPTWQSPLIREEDGRRFVPRGTEIDQSEHLETDCVALVRNGEAIPTDDECRDAVKMSPIQIAAAVAAQERWHKMQESEQAEE